MIKYELTKLQKNIFVFLCENVGKTINQTDLAKALGVSAAAVVKAMPGIKNLVDVKRVGRINLLTIELNRSIQKNLYKKRVENLGQLYESGVVDYLKESSPGSTIILFGSYSRGEDIFSSDIDIAIVNAKSKKLKLNKYDKILGKTINISFYESFKIDKPLKENLCNGIVLSGGVEL